MTNVKYTLETLPKVSKNEIERINAINDNAIDLSDIPELTDDFWETAIMGQFYRPKKQQITIKLDADVLYWLKSNGKGYQTRLNAILRKTMIQALEKEKNHS